MEKIEYTAGVKRPPKSKREEQIERIRDLIDEKPGDDLPVYECAAGKDHGCAVTMMEAFSLIPRGRKNAVSKRKLCKKYGIEVRIMDDWISRAGQYRTFICEQRGRIWLADSEDDMMRVFDQERKGITYR